MLLRYDTEICEGNCDEKYLRTGFVSDCIKKSSDLRHIAREFFYRKKFLRSLEAQVK